MSLFRDYPGLDKPIVKFNDRGVTVTRESTHRKEFWCTGFSDLPDPIWITFDQLYEVLAHGKPGEYILKDA